MTEPAHYKRGPSSAGQWLICTDSPEAQEGYPDKSGPAADEGTAAHWLLEQCLLSRSDAQAYVDSMDEAVIEAGEATGCEKDWPISGEMIEAIQMALDTVMPDIKKKGTRLFVEERVYLGRELGLRDTIGGTADILIYLPRSKILKVWDLKYGKGHFVSATWDAVVFDGIAEVPASSLAGFDANPQAAIYGAAAINDLERLTGEKLEVKEVQVGIIQPRIKSKKGFVRTTKLTPLTIEIVEMAVMDADRDRGVRMAGDHCLFCKAKGDCAKYAEYEGWKATKGFTAESKDVVAAPAAAPVGHELAELPAKDLGTLISRPVKGLTLAELGMAHDVVKTVTKWVAEIQKETLSRLEHDLEVPGKRLAPGRGARTYGGTYDQLLIAARTTAMLGYAEFADLVTPQTVLSAAKLEEKLGAKTFKETPLAEYVTFVAAKKPVVVDEGSDAPKWAPQDNFEAEEAPKSSLL